MFKLWSKLSYLGIENKSKTLDNRSNVLLNQINIAIALTLTVLLIVMKVEKLFTGGPSQFGTVRVILMICLTIINLILARFKLFSLSKFFLIYLGPIVLVFLPTFVGFVEEESYMYYPIVLIGLSMIPPLVLPIRKKKFQYIVSLFYYLVLIVIYDWLLNYFNPNESIIFQSITKFYLYYKVVPIVTFIFTALSVYYIRNINFNFENEIFKKNQALDQHNEELRSIIEKLKLTQNQLVHSEKMAALGNLTAGISHEINNPLNYINGGNYFVQEVIDYLKKKEGSPNPDYMIELLYQADDMVSKGVTKVSQIVQLLTVFSLEKKSEKQAIHLSELLDGTICFITVKTNEKISIEKDFNFNGTVMIYHDQIHQVMINIFTNAIEAIEDSPEGGSGLIRISTNSVNIDNQVFVEIEVFNSGPQVTEEELLKIFEPFYTTKITEVNSGLGLSVAYTTIKKHNGSIEAHNKNDGFSITIILPLQ